MASLLGVPSKTMGAFGPMDEEWFSIMKKWMPVGVGLTVLDKGKPVP